MGVSVLLLVLVLVLMLMLMLVSMNLIVIMSVIASVVMMLLKRITTGPVGRTSTIRKSMGADMLFYIRFFWIGVSVVVSILVPRHGGCLRIRVVWWHWPREISGVF
jgi:hypothetical protein